MTDGMMDIQGDLLKDAIKNATGQIHLMFKDKKPFRQEPIDPRQRVIEFETMPDEERDFAMRNFPNEYAEMSQNMDKLRRRTGVNDGR